MKTITNFAALFLTIPIAALAGTVVPEIDATTGPAALGLLFGAVMVIRARRKTHTAR